MSQAIRYAQLDYVALNVNDLTRSKPFYEDIVGLTPIIPRRDGTSAFAVGTDERQIVLFEAPEPGLKRLGWLLASHDALQAAIAHLSAHDIPYERLTADDSIARAIIDGLRVVEPTTGAAMDLFVSNEPSGANFAASHTKIERLGHVVLASPDAVRSAQFMVDMLNFRLSDSVGDAIQFLRCFPNMYHHSLAFSEAATPHLHHVNFMVEDFDDVGRALNRLKRNNVPIVFGPGRHPPSDSVFLYFLDPDGLTLEYSFGMETFEEHVARDPRRLPFALESLDSWGGKPEPGMGETGAIERAGETANA